MMDEIKCVGAKLSMCNLILSVQLCDCSKAVNVFFFFFYKK